MKKKPSRMKVGRGLLVYTTERRERSRLKEDRISFQISWFSFHDNWIVIRPKRSFFSHIILLGFVYSRGRINDEKAKDLESSSFFP
jgi:hypothetical protein